MARFYPTSIAAAVLIIVLIIFMVPRLQNSKDDIDILIKSRKNGENGANPEKVVEISNDVGKMKQKNQDEDDSDNEEDDDDDEEDSYDSTGEEADEADESVVSVMLTSDNKTLGGLVAAVNSIRLNTVAHVKFYLLVDKVSIPHLRKWIKSTDLKNIDYVLKTFNESLVRDKIKVRDARKDLGTPLNFARYYFPLIFPHIKGRLVFIDADSIVHGDIKELRDVTIEAGHAAAFSDDCSAISHRSSLIQVKYMDFLNFNNPTIKALKLNPMTCSFNTGVYVIDVAEWKKQQITKHLDRWLALNSFEELYGNQKGGGNSGPPFFIVFYKKYTTLSPEWNVRYLGITSGTRYSDSFVKSAKLLHWNGPFKPWGRTAQHTDDWDKYYIADPTGKFKIIRKYGRKLL